MDTEVSNWSLEVNKLEKAVNHSEGGVVARCPACAAEGGDTRGEHLRIFPDGRFACVVNPGESGGEHRKVIFKLVGKKRRTGRWIPLCPKRRKKG